MSSVDLVFRTVGERTSSLALELALEAIRPKKVFVVEDIRPLCEAVDMMRRIPHRSDYIVYVDADCLILQDMVPYLQRTTRPYVDCFVLDPFRGRIHCGVHITRADLVGEMARLELPVDDAAFVLRPESRLRNMALARLGQGKCFKSFDILHDYFQYYRDVFGKYALRELRSRRNAARRESLEIAMTGWVDRDGTRDHTVARAAVDHSRANVPAGAGAAELADYLARVDVAATEVLASLGIDEKPPLERPEVEAFRRAHRVESEMLVGKPRVFGIGLSRTGTRSLTAALHAIGFDTVHYPADAGTLEALKSGRADFPVLEECDGITDITVAPYYAQLDRRYPGSKFILTVREKQAWLRSARYHWTGRSAFEEAEGEERGTYLEVRRLLRAAVYGCYEFDEERFSWVYDQHVRNVQHHFAGRPEDLLVVDLCGGEGWQRLCAFLGRAVPNQPFPHKGRALTARLAGGDDDTPPPPRVSA